jgi:hypothetical protein
VELGPHREPTQVVRGSAAFAVSLMCTRMDPLLRATAEMGSWMVISPGKHETVVGKLLVVEELSSIQEQVSAAWLGEREAHGRARCMAPW